MFAITLIFVATSAWSESQPDLEREKRLAAEIADAVMDGDVVEITADAQTFIGIYTETDADAPKGAAIILHGRGFHPDWEDTIQPLRVGLTEFGWNTLSIQMPVLEKTAKYYDYVPIFEFASPRIEEAIAFLKEAGNEKIVLIAHSCGAHMAMTWFSAHGDDNIDAYVGLGMGATDYKQPMAQPFPLQEMKVPVLDVYGEDEYSAVIKMAPERLAMMQAAGNSQSEQAVVPGADHYFKDKGAELTEVVAAWLDKI